MAATEVTLADTLTALVQATPGVTRLYAPTRAVPGVSTARRVLTDLEVPVPAAHVVVDEGRNTVSASIGIDLSASAGEIGRAVCLRIGEQLARTGHDMELRVTIAYITG